MSSWTVRTCLAAGLALLLTAVPLSAFTLVLNNGQRLELQQFRVVGDTIEGTLISGKPWSSYTVNVDFQQTYLTNLRGSERKSIFLSRGKVLEFDEIEITGNAARLRLGDAASINVPLKALDFQNTVIEQGRLQGARTKARGSSGTVPSPRPREVDSPAAERRPRNVSRAIRPQRLSREGDAVDRPEPVDTDRDEIPRPEEALEPPTLNRYEDHAEPFDLTPDTPDDMDQEDFGDGASDYRQPRRITRAEVVQKVDPIYDETLVPEGRGLTALLEVTVGPSGTVSNVKVIKSTGNPELDAAGVEAANQYIFTPAEKDGVPFESRRLERITFRRPTD